MKTLQGAGKQNSDPLAFNLVRLAALCGLLGALLNFWGSRPGTAETVQFTLYVQGVYWLQLFGFVGTLLLVAAYHFLPRVSDQESALSGPFGWKSIMMLHATGSILVGLVYVLGGWKQGKALADASRSFLEVQSAAMSFNRNSTIGELLVFLAAAVLAVNMTRSLVAYLVGYIKCCCNCGVRAIRSKGFQSCKRISTFLCHFSCHGGLLAGAGGFPQVRTGNQSTREVKEIGTTLPNPDLWCSTAVRSTSRLDV